MLYHVVYEAVYTTEGQTIDYGGDAEIHVNTTAPFIVALLDAWEHGKKIDADLMELKVIQTYTIEKEDDLNAQPPR